MLAVGTDLLADAGDVDVDHPVENHHLVGPDLLEQLGPCEDASFVRKELKEYLELLAGHPHLRAVDRTGASACRELKSVVRNDIRLGNRHDRGSRRASKHRTHPGEQSLQRIWFRNVVVRPEVKTAYHILLVVAGRAENYRYFGGGGIPLHYLGKLYP